MRKSGSKCGGLCAEPPGKKGEGYLVYGRKGSEEKEGLGKGG